MEDQTKASLDIESLMHTWSQSMNDIMGNTLKMWSTFQPPHQPGQNTQNTQNTQGNLDNETIAAIKAGLNCWQTVATAMATPESMRSFFKGSSTIPEIYGKFVQASIRSLSELQKKMAQTATRFGESVDAYRFEKTDDPLFHAWTEIYENEFQKFFKIPQFGLTREYQEKINDILDKFHLFQATLAEFLRLLSLPFQRSLGMMQDKIADLVKNDKMPEDPQEYYKMWIKILEGHFMTLYQTPEYVESLVKTVGALCQLSEAKDAVLEDFMRILPVAQKSEMDELAKEVYELKRRVRKLEKSTR